MNSDNPPVIYCEVDEEYRVYCDVGDKLCIEGFYKNHLKSQTDINNIRKVEQLDKSCQVISLFQIWIYFVKYVIEKL